MSAQASVGMSCDENVDFGKKSGVGSLPPEFHFHIQQEVFGLLDLALQVDDARVGVEPAGAEEALLVALGDGEDDVVPGVGGRRPDAEDVGWHHDVGLEVELVVGDAHRRVLALQVVEAADALTPPEERGKRHLQWPGNSRDKHKNLGPLQRIGLTPSDFSFCFFSRICNPAIP